MVIFVRIQHSGLANTVTAFSKSVMKRLWCVYIIKLETEKSTNV